MKDSRCCAVRIEPGDASRPPASLAQVHLGPAVQRKIRRLVLRLLDAQEDAPAAGRSAWDFAVEIGCLRALDCTNNDLRWLVCKGYVEHGVETTIRADAPRKGLNFCSKTCFVLTESGKEYARTLIEAD